MTKFIKETIAELKFSLEFELKNRTETNYNGLAIATYKRRLETALDAEFLLEIGEITENEAEAMVAEALSI